MAVRDVVQAAAGVGGGDNLYVEDVFSTYLYTGNGATQTIENGIALGDSNFGGSGVFTSGAYLEVTPEVIGAGDFTIEFWVNQATISNYPTAYTQGYGQAGSFAIQAGSADGKWKVYISGSVVLSETTSTVNANTWYHIAITRSGSTVRLFRDGVQTGSGTSSVDVNFSGAATISYPTADLIGRVSNFRYVKGTALYTSAFTPPTSALTAISGTKLLTLQGDTPFLDNSTNALSITNVGTVSASKVGPYTEAGYGEGGLVWLKDRLSASLGFHTIYDTEGGTGPNGGRIFAGTAGANPRSTQADGLQSFDSTGFTLGANTYENGSGKSFASWSWRKSPKFFDVVTWSGNSTAGRTVAHNLGSAPGFVLVKRTNTSNNWATWHRGIANNEYLSINSASPAYGDGGIFWNNTTPDASNLTLGDDSAVNGTGSTYVAYLFAHDAGGFGDDGEQNVISCGSYTGTGSSASGSSPIINLGWEPQWLLIKRTGPLGSGEWVMLDNMRGINLKPTDDRFLFANLADAETGNNYADINATGFEVNSTNGNVNDNGYSYIYIAIRRPMKTPESGTEVFAPISRTGTGSATTVSGVGFAPDMVIPRRTNTDANWWVTDRLRGPHNWLAFDQTGGEGIDALGVSDYTMDGFSLGNSFSTNATSAPYINYALRRAPGFMDVVCYTGDGATPNNVTHNLGVLPELVMVKGRSNTGGWFVWLSSDPTFNYLLSSPDFKTASLRIAGATSSSFAVNNSTDTNTSTYTYVAHLFASLPGVSKVGSYTGTGANLNVDCGFSAGARFVLIKRTDASGDWYVWDSARGITAGNDPYLLINTYTAQNTGTDYIDPLASGFTVTSNASSTVNVDTGTYIFLAIA